jgi:hypothetical protein
MLDVLPFVHIKESEETTNYENREHQWFWERENITWIESVHDTSIWPTANERIYPIAWISVVLFISIVSWLTIVIAKPKNRTITFIIVWILSLLLGVFIYTYIKRMNSAPEVFPIGL